MNAKRSILDRVAAGELGPQEAAALLDELDQPGTAGVPPPEPRPPTGEVTTIRVDAELGRVTVLGDPTVTTVAATGEHEITTDGDTLRVRCAPETRQWGFVMMPSRGDRSREGGTRIRVNPALALDLHLAAGKMSVDGVTGPITASVELGSLTINGFDAPIDLTTAAGMIVATGRLDRGISRVQCELGKVRLHLAADSSVVINGRAELGSVALPHGRRIAGLEATSDAAGEQVVLGDGAGQLDVQTSAGWIGVSVAD